MATGKRTGIKGSGAPAPLNVTSLTATDVGTNRPYLATANTTSAASAAGTGGAVTLSWTLPAASPAATSYIITSTPSTYTVNTGSASTSYTFQGLASNTSYTFTVSTVSVGGTSSGTTSTSTLATTVPAAPAAPTVSTVANQSTDVVTWVAPATGGKAITGYIWSSSDGKTNASGGTPGGGATASTQVNVTQEAGTAQTYNVYAINANGNSLTSANSASFTSFSFTPFSVFSFAPFSVFSFAPFGSVFTFTPAFGSVFSFAPFSVFSFTPWYWLDGGNSLAPEINISLNNPETGEQDFININNIEIGNIVSSFDIINKEKTHSIVSNTVSNNVDEAMLIDGEVYTNNHKMFVKKDNIETFVYVNELDTSYEKYSVSNNNFMSIFSVEKIEVPIVAVTIECQTNNNYIANDVVLSD